MTKQTAELICAALLAIVAALRKEHGLPDYRGVTIHVELPGDNETVAGVKSYSCNSEN
jgi:hypothetical protein